MATCTILYGSQVLSATEESTVNITYNNQTIGSVSEGSSKCLLCGGKNMASDVTIGSKKLLCANKVMADNVTVTFGTVYRWGKYNVNTVQSYEMVESGTGSFTNMSTSATYYTTSAPPINSSGKFDLSGGSSAVVSGNNYSGKYWAGTTSGFTTGTSVVDSVVQVTAYSSWLIAASVTVTAYSVNTTTTQERGTYIADVVSSVQNAYPDNGIQDGYWYVRIQ